MEPTALCQDRGRLQALREQATINAIDYLVVVDGAGVPEGLRQRLLVVRFLSDVGVDALDKTHVSIEGGVRVEDPDVRWAQRLSDLDPATIDDSLNTSEQSFLANLKTDLDEPNSWLVVMLEEYGDFSVYRLVLREGGAAPTGLKFDQILSEIEFSFKVECPSPFDCLVEEECPTEVETEPELDYLSRDFKSFRRLMFDRLALIAPDDSSSDPAMLRTALVEVLAYAADRLAYFQDAVATEAYLGRARRRVSIRRHARLLDYPMHEGCNARAFVHIALDTGVEVSGTPLTEGTAFLSRHPTAGTVVKPGDLEQILVERPAVFEAMLVPEVFTAAHNEINFYTWGDGDCCLPAGATEACLLDDGGLRLAAGELLVFEQTRSPDTGLAEDADPELRHVVRLVEVGDSVEDLLFPGTFTRTVRWHADDALPFGLVLSVGNEPVAVARGNLVLADHGFTIGAEALEIREWGNQGGLRAKLERTGLSWSEPIEDVSSATALGQQEPRNARALIKMEGEGESWTPVADLLSSSASGREFVVEMESDGIAWLRFGDDVMGRRPADLADFSVTYRIGNGREGNVGAESVAHVVSHPERVDATLTTAITTLRNPLPATGGTSAETIDEVKRYAPHAFRVQQRAVTELDWAEVAERHNDVQRAVAKLRWTGSWNTVHVTVDPVAGTAFSDLEADLSEYLDPFRLAGYDLKVVSPTYVPLDIALTVCVDPNYFEEDVASALKTEFGTGQLEDGRLGFFHPDEFSFGDSVWLSKIISHCMRVDGVRWVDVLSAVNDNRFKRRGEVQGNELEEGRIRIGELEIARCDNDPNAPDNGQIRFYMESSR